MNGGKAFNIYRGLVNRGLPSHVAEGIVMNLQDESGLDAGINEIAPIVPGSRGGFGLAQWTGPRRRALEAFAADRGMPVDDEDLQLDFLMYELQGPEKAAFDRTMAAGSAGDAAAAFATNFLRPAKSHLDRRVAEYTGSDPGLSEMAGGFGPMMPQNPTFPTKSADEQNALRLLDLARRTKPVLLDASDFMNRHRYV